MKVDWPRRQLVMRADAREDAVHEADGCAVGRHERADLRHQHDQRHLPQIGRFAAHVRPGDDAHAAVRVQCGSRWEYSGPATPICSITGCRPPTISSVLVVINGRAHVVVARAPSRRSSQHVQFRDSPRHRQHVRAMPPPRAPARPGTVRTPARSSSRRRRCTMRLVLLQVRRDIAFAVGGGLLAHVVVRHVAEIGLRDLDVVAEDGVVADFERVDAGAFALACLEVRDPGLCVAGGVRSLSSSMS